MGTVQGHGLWLGVLGMAAVLLGPGMVGGVEEPPLRQPVQYNHKVHAEELALACPNCHEGTEIRRRAGFPPDDFCRACHSSPQSDSAKEAKLLELLDSGQPLRWVQVTRLADYVLFSHRRHVAIGNIDCSACHGDMRERTVPISAPPIDFQGRAGMFRCIECHIDSGSPYAGVECLSCHR
jgi:hypothetical protein